MSEAWLARVARDYTWATYQESFASLSSDRDFAVFLRSVIPADVLWEGYGTGTYLQWRLWQVKTAA